MVLAINDTVQTQNGSVVKIVGKTHHGYYIVKVIHGGHGGCSYFPGSRPGTHYNVDTNGQYVGLGGNPNPCTDERAIWAHHLAIKD
jgi:hypothetical protein